MTVTILSEQEKLEADALIAMWQNFCASEGSSKNLSLDVEEIVLGYHAKIQKIPADDLKKIVEIFNPVLACAKEFHARVTRKFETFGIVPGIGNPPEWLHLEVKNLEGQIGKFAQEITDNQESISIWTNILMNSIERNPNFPDATLKFLNDFANVLASSGDLWTTSQKQIRQKVKKCAENLKPLRENILNVLRIWVGNSQIKHAYLKSKGVYINASALNKQIISKPAPSKPVLISSRRKKKSKVMQNLCELQKDETDSIEKAWNVICFNSGVTAIAEFKILFSDPDNCQNFTKLLNKEYSWPRNWEETIDKLQKFINKTPEERVRYGSYHYFNQTWRSIRYGKYRLHVSVKDDERTIFLIAGHVNEINVIAGRAKNES